MLNFKSILTLISMVLCVFGKQSSLQDPETRYISVVFDQKSKSLVIKNDTNEDYVARAAFKNSMNESGYVIALPSLVIL